MLQNNAGLGFFMSLAYMSMFSYKRWSWLLGLFRQGWTRHVSTSVIVYGGLYDHYQWCHEPRPMPTDSAHCSTRDCFDDSYLSLSPYIRNGFHFLILHRLTAHSVRNLCKHHKQCKSSNWNQFNDSGGEQEYFCFSICKHGVISLNLTFVTMIFDKFFLPIFKITLSIIKFHIFKYVENKDV